LSVLTRAEKVFNSPSSNSMIPSLRRFVTKSLVLMWIILHLLKPSINWMILRKS